MASNTRIRSRRKIEFAAGNLDNAGSHLQEVIETYQEFHPEISNPLTTIQEIILEIINQLEAIKGRF
jgi:hypothetical protein